MERYLPGTEGEIWYEHWHRYHFVKELVRGKQVMDVACGEGYGAALLATTAAHVTAIDAATDVIVQARRRYGGRNNLTLCEARCESIPMLDASIDVVVSFETLEHLADPLRFLDEAARILRPDGLFIVSTPNKEVYTDQSGYHNPHHLHEFERDELLTALRARFKGVSLWGQRVDVYSAIWPLEGNAAGCQLLDARNREAQQPLAGIADPVYFVALCSRDGRQPDLDFSLLSDRDHYKSRDADALHGRIAHLQAQLERAEAGYLAVQHQLVALAADHERALARLATLQGAPPEAGWRR